jgi:hypothetical protein
VRDRIGVCSVAAMLSTLLGFMAVHQTQARNPRIGWTFLTASVPDSFELAASLALVEGTNIGKIRANEISSADGSGDRRCKMSPEEFAKAYPPLIAWIRNTLTASAHVAKTVGSHGFSRLPLYFTEETLASTKVVSVDPLPMPPLSSMGLARFADFVRGDSDGITYIDTIFLKPTQSNNENVHFHELVHVIQWRLLGPDRFLLAYANGLECFGYQQSPLEAMAYDAETEFAGSTLIFNAEKLVAEKLGV